MTYEEYLKSEHWQQVRKLALEWADSRCQVCNSEHFLHVHHRTYRRLGKEWLQDLTVLCTPCHRLFHNREILCFAQDIREEINSGLVPAQETLAVAEQRVLEMTKRALNLRDPALLRDTIIPVAEKIIAMKRKLEDAKAHQNP